MAVFVLHPVPKISVLVVKPWKETLNIKWITIFQFNFQVKEEVLLFVRSARVSSACLTQTIVLHATSRGIQIDSINVEVEGDVNLRGFTGIDSKVRPEVQQFRVNLKINSNTASKDQINELHEIGKKFSPAFDTLTNGTSVVIVGS